MLQTVFTIFFGILAAAAIYAGVDLARQKRKQYIGDPRVILKQKKQTEDLEQLRKHVQTHPEMSVAHIEELLEISRSTALYYIEELKKEGFSERVNSSDTYIFYMKESGEES